MMNRTFKTGASRAQPGRREVYRWVHEDVLDRHSARMQGAGTLT